MSQRPASPKPNPAEDTAFLDFLAERLQEERAAATGRSASPSATPDPDHTDRSLHLIEELLGGLGAGRAPDRMSCDLLVVAYSHHADFRPEWNRWRQAATRGATTQNP